MPPPSSLLLFCGRNGDAERNGVQVNGYKQTVNGNGVIHSPLPPDGMYHVSENGLLGENGNGAALAASLSDKVYSLKQLYQLLYF